MNRISLLLILTSLLVGYVRGQGKVNSYAKLCLENDKQEILLVQYKGIWELAGKSFDTPRSIREQVAFMAQEMGVSVTDIRLRGLFSIYHNAGPMPILFHYYSARYASGPLTVPPGCTDIRWFSRQEALKVIPFKVMTQILAQLFSQETYLWGGSLHVNNGATFEVNDVSLKEPFYRLN
jgi:hypothetical protein